SRRTPSKRLNWERVARSTAHAACEVVANSVPNPASGVKPGESQAAPRDPPAPGTAGVWDARDPDSFSLHRSIRRALVQKVRWPEAAPLAHEVVDPGVRHAAAELKHYLG